jgi:hypothetical protein
MFEAMDGGTLGARTKSAAHKAGDSDLEALALGCVVDAKVSLAGPIAEQLRFPIATKAQRRRREFGWGEDQLEVHSSVAQAVLARDGVVVKDKQTVTLTPEQAAAATELHNRLHIEVEKLIKDNWSAVTRVAEVLVTQPFPDQEKLDALIAGDRD